MASLLHGFIVINSNGTMKQWNNNKIQRILIDGRFIGVGESMSRYCLELVAGILAIDKTNQYTLLIRPEGEKLTANSLQLKANNLKFKILDIPHYSLGEQTKLLKYLNKEKFDLVHFIQFNHPVRYRGKFVVTIHDLTLYHDLYKKEHIKRFGFDRVMKSAVKNSKKIITISETTKKALVDRYKIDPKKVVVTYLGVDQKYNQKLKTQNQKINNFKDKYNILGDYILYTGMWKKHKNIVSMLRSFEKLKIQDTRNKNQIILNSQTSNLQLVLVGKVDEREPKIVREIERINSVIASLPHGFIAKNNNGTTRLDSEVIGLGWVEPRRKPRRMKQWSNDKLRNSNSLKSVICTGFVDEEDLLIAYAGALAYIIPSLSEGFGLPPLEAMACGTPVISSKISAMPEILGEAAFYFDPYNINSIKGAMEKIVSDSKLRDQLSKKGLERVKKYNWQSTAKKTFEVYSDVLKIDRHS